MEKNEKNIEVTEKIVRKFADLLNTLSDIIKQRREAKKQAEITHKKAMEMQQLQMWIAQLQVKFANLFALALSQMPSHLMFYGTISANVLQVVYIKAHNLWRVYIPCNTANAPATFHIFKNTLQNILVNIYQTALCNLQNQIQSDRYQFQIDSINYMNFRTWQGKTFDDYLADYIKLYRAECDRLFCINIITVKAETSGISIIFTFMFNDGGLSPDNYSL